MYYIDDAVVLLPYVFYRRSLWVAGCCRNAVRHSAVSVWAAVMELSAMLHKSSGSEPTSAIAKEAVRRPTDVDSTSIQTPSDKMRLGQKIFQEGSTVHLVLES